MPQSLSAVYIHLVFSTKERRPFLHDKSVREKLHAQLGGISKTLECPPLLVGGSHPGYWRKGNPTSQGTQAVESQSANLDQGSCNVPRSLPGTLQDFFLAQDPAFVGLISMVTGSTLQEDIAATTRQLLLRGRNILGCVSPETTQNANPTPCYEPQTSPAARAAASHSPQLQLRGPSIGS